MTHIDADEIFYHTFIMFNWQTELIHPSAKRNFVNVPEFKYVTHLYIASLMSEK